MGSRHSHRKDVDKIYEEAGIRFTHANNKSLRLYFQSQFTPEMEDEDLLYLNHIFEIKVYLYFHRHYNTWHLMDTQKFLEETFEKNIETIFNEIKGLEILESETDENQDEVIDDYFSFQKHRAEEIDYTSCRINYFLHTLKEISPTIELSADFRSKVKMTRELEIYSLLNDNTNVLYFVLKRIYESYNTELKKIVIYQVGLKTIDELMYTVLASFLRKIPTIQSVCVIEKTIRQLKHIELPNEGEYENDERLENPIINRQHLFNFYQSLSARTNLLELRVLFFLTDYNFIMLSHVILLNKDLRILQVRNVSTKDSDSMGRDLDYAYYELLCLGENLRDEIFIFFNYLSQLEHLEQLYITHFAFNSEINFLACEIAKKLKKLRILSLDKNQAIINNDLTALESFHFADTNLRKLNLGLTYLNKFRKFEYLINIEQLRDVNIGVLDFVSFSAFVRYLPTTLLERVTLTLNKPTSIESIPFLFEQIYTYAFSAKTLKYFYVLNAYSNYTYKEKAMNVHLMKLIEKMKINDTIRKLSFKKPCILYTSIKETDGEKADGIRTFRYINKKDYNMCTTVLLILKNVFRYDDYFHHQFSSTKEVFYDKIFRNICSFRFATYRKIVLE
jgi:hypothetical protein